MTVDEWLSLKVGDWVHDVVAGRDRQVLEVTRGEVRRGTKYPRVRTWITVDSLKSPGRRVHVVDTMDGRGGRYRLGKAAP